MGRFGGKIEFCWFSAECSFEKAVLFLRDVAISHNSTWLLSAQSVVMWLQGGGAAIIILNLGHKYPPPHGFFRNFEESAKQLVVTPELPVLL